MRKPDTVYKETKTVDNIKAIDDFTAEQCLYFLQRYCLKHPGCFGCSLCNSYGKCDIMQAKSKPYEWRIER